MPTGLQQPSRTLTEGVSLADVFALFQDEVLTLQVQTAEAAGDAPNATEQLPAHRHTAFVDANGNGITEPAEGHRHIVKEWTVLEALGHDHGELAEDDATELDQTAATDRGIRFRAGAFELPMRLAEDDAEPSSRGLIEGKPIQVMKTGTFKHPESGEFEITREFMDLLIENADRFGRQIHFDYDHGSEHHSSDPEKSGRAAGWVKELYREGDWLWAVPLWTERAFQAIEAGEWRYISPAFRGRYVKEGNEELGPVLTSIAITNHPFLKDMEPIAANERGEFRWLLMEAGDSGPESVVELLDRAAQHRLQAPFTAEEVQILYPDWTPEQASAWVEAYDRAEQQCQMDGPEPEDLQRADYDQEQACQYQAARIAREAAWNLTEENNDMKKLAEVLGLSEDATEDQITAAVQALSERAEAIVAAFKEALGLDEVPEDPEELVAAAERSIEHRLSDKDGGSEPKVPEGMQLVDKDKLSELEQGAQQAESASKRLTEMEAKERIRELKGDNRIVSKSQEEYGRRLYTEQGEKAFEAWAKTLDSNKELAELRRRSSHDQEPEHELTDEQQEAVKLFNEKVDEIAEKDGVSMGTAIRRASQQFPKLAERYTLATEPETRA